MRIIDKQHDFYDYLQDPTDSIAFDRRGSFLLTKEEFCVGLRYQRYGYQSYLFEELEPYDESILLHEQKKWQHSILEASREDIRAGRFMPMDETISEIRRKYQI